MIIIALTLKDFDHAYTQVCIAFRIKKTQFSLKKLEIILNCGPFFRVAVSEILQNLVMVTLGHQFPAETASYQR